MRNRMRGARRLIWLTLVSSSVSLFLFSQNPPGSQSAMEREFQAAISAQEKGDLDSAQAILLKLRKEHPGIFAVDESLGMIYVAQEKYAEALPLLQAAVREQPLSDAAHANAGAALYRLHRNTESLSEFQRAVQLNPANASTQQSLGELLLEAGKPRQAADAFKSALDAKKDDPGLELKYAGALIAAGDLDHAQEIVASLPGADTSADTQALSAEIDEKRGDFKSAVDHLSRAAELDPSEENLWALSVEFLRHWTFDAAIPEFEAAARKYPASERMKLGLAAAYFGGAKYADAIPVFAGLLHAHKNNALYAEMLGMACNAASSGGKADCTTLIDYAQTHPHDGRAAMYAASLLLTETSSNAQTAEGKKLLAQALAADPKLPNAQYLMGLTKQNDGDWPASIPYLEKAIALKPDLAQAHYRLALAYWRTGHKQEAQHEMDLQKKYAQQERQDLDRRLRQITTFVVDVRN